MALDCPDGYKWNGTDCVPEDGGTTDDSDSDSTTSISWDDISGKPSIPSWDDLVPGWLSNNIGFLKTFANNPKATIIGAILAVIIGGVETVWTTILESLQYLWYGDSMTSTAGKLGIADIPIMLANVLIDASSPLGSTIIGLIDSMLTSLDTLITGFGPLAFPITVAAIMGVLIVTERLATRLGPALLEAIPVIGPFLKNLIVGP